MRGFCAFLVALTINGCSSDADVSVAEREVSIFHDKFDDQEFDEIYTATAPQFKDSTPKDDYLQLMSIVHQKLGTVQATERNSSNVLYRTDGTTVTLGYATEFEQGPGIETFVFSMQDGKARLINYKINSTALIVN